MGLLNYLRRLKVSLDLLLKLDSASKTPVFLFFRLDEPVDEDELQNLDEPGELEDEKGLDNVDEVGLVQNSWSVQKLPARSAEVAQSCSHRVLD